jgi:hypothetical protein
MDKVWQVIGVILTAVGVAVTWYYASKAAVRTEAQNPAVTPPTQIERVVPAQTPHPRVESGEEPHAKERRSPTTSSQPVEPTLPLDFTLRDGEQRTFLGDQASVAAEFNQVGSEDFVTLRVGTTEGESVPHAVLGAGARFPVRVAGNKYSVYVLSVDKTARTVGVRISRNSESQERGQ